MNGGSLTLYDVVLDSSTSSITVVATDLDIRNLVFATDKVDVTGSEVSLDAATLAALESITVVATDLDIRDLINTQDSIAIGDSTSIIDVQTLDSAFDDVGNGFILAGVRQDAAGSPVSADGDAHPLVFNNDGELKVAADLTSDTADDAVDAGNPIKVGGRGVSGLLTALSASGDRYHLLGDLYRRTWTNSAYNVGHKVSLGTIGATAAEIVSTPLAGRTGITIQNVSVQSVWLGHSNAVTADNTATGGIEIPKNSSYSDSFGENIDLWLISDGAGRLIKIHEKG